MNYDAMGRAFEKSWSSAADRGAETGNQLREGRVSGNTAHCLFLVKSV